MSLQSDHPVLTASISTHPVVFDRWGRFCDQTDQNLALELFVHLFDDPMIILVDPPLVTYIPFTHVVRE